MEEFKSAIGIIAYAIEGFGVLVIVTGSLIATGRYLSRLLRGTASPDRAGYVAYRRDVGHAIILGLEFLIAGDVVRTVIVSHTPTDIAVLGLIVVVRAFLSFTLALEIEGRWPWQGRPADGAATS